MAKGFWTVEKPFPDFVSFLGNLETEVLLKTSKCIAFLEEAKAVNICKRLFFSASFAWASG